MSWFKSRPLPHQQSLRPRYFRRARSDTSNFLLSENLPLDNLPLDNSTVYQDALDPRFHSLPHSGNTSSNVSMWSADDNERAQLRESVSQVARIELLQSSLANPQLAPQVRRVLEAALELFVRTEQSQQELLPPYTEDLRPPYKE